MINDAVPIDDEAHHAGVAIALRPGDQRITIGHQPIAQIALRAAWRILALCCEQAIEITVIGHPRLGIGETRAKRALGFAGQRRPVQAIALAGRGQRTLGEVFGRLAIGVLREVFLLRIGVGQRDLDGGEFVATDASGSHLGRRGPGIESPA